jgi:hypothetical protein
MRRHWLIAPLALASCTRMEPRAEAPVATAPTAAEAAPTPARPAARSFHDFVPSLNGFQFRNGFQGSILGTGESAYGLCGGMSFAAADYYLANMEPPRDSKPPADGTPLFKYIYSRQATSFGTLGAMGLKFVEWMQLPDEGADSVHSRTLAELPLIESVLARGEPVVLGLVLVSTRDKGKAWDNHQVLAFHAASVQPPHDADLRAPTLTILRIYDSNFPLRDDVTISISRGGEKTAIAMHIPGRRDMPIRGFFRMAYSPVTPPKLNN